MSVCNEPQPINGECKKILKAILKSQKEATKSLKQLSSRFDTRVDYVDALRDGFMSLEKMKEKEKNLNMQLL